jgi:hypothetical protein
MSEYSNSNYYDNILLHTSADCDTDRYHYTKVHGMALILIWTLT